MNDQTLKTADELFEMLSAAKSDHSRHLISFASDAAREYERIRGDLLGAMEYCRRELERAGDAMKGDGRMPNSLGILQNNGVEVDRLCGELTRTRDAALAAQRLLAKLGIE